MSEKLDFEGAFEGLPPEEAEALRRKIVQSVHGTIQAHKAEKETARVEPLIEAYKREIKAAQGQRHLGDGIRAKYRALGVPVDTISFKV